MGNTSLDHLKSRKIEFKSGTRNYGLVTLHRQELLENPDLFIKTVDIISKSVGDQDIFFFSDHRSQNLLKSQKKIYTNISFKDKMSHPEFIDVLSGAEWVITDSGGIQEECAFLGLPTLIHRVATERYEGLGQNIVLSKWEEESIRQFLLNYKNYKRSATLLEQSPSLIVLQSMRVWGLI
jgi:UDP-N-acetylglucosamine 2-epimerase (non-hydrolysing)